MQITPEMVQRAKYIAKVKGLGRCSEFVITNKGKFPVLMEDEPLHTDEHPFCDDPTCPCHDEEDYQEVVLGITINEQRKRWGLDEVKLNLGVFE